jgi:hypothetical protein
MAGLPTIPGKERRTGNSSSGRREWRVIHMGTGVVRHPHPRPIIPCSKQASPPRKMRKSGALCAGTRRRAAFPLPLSFPWPSSRTEPMRPKTIDARERPEKHVTAAQSFSVAGIWRRGRFPEGMGNWDRWPAARLHPQLVAVGFLASRGNGSAARWLTGSCRQG